MQSVNLGILRQINEASDSGDQSLDDSTLGDRRRGTRADASFRTEMTLDELAAPSTYEEFIGKRVNFYGGKNQGLIRFHGDIQNISISGGGITVSTDRGQWWSGIEDPCGGKHDPDFRIPFDQIEIASMFGSMLSIRTRDLATYQFE